MTKGIDLPDNGPDGPLYAKVAKFLAETGMSTCTITDALDGLGVPNAVLDSRLTRRSRGTEMSFGAAYPVSWAPVRKTGDISSAGPSTWSEVRDFLVPEVTDGTGMLYVGGAGRLVTEAALAGGMSTTYLIESLGFQGIVLGGAIRDREIVEKCDAAVVASNFIPTDTQGSFRVVSVGETCLIGDTHIARGDYVFTDGNGTVVVPRAVLRDTLAAAAAIEVRESMVMGQVRQGRRLPEMVDEVGQI